MAPTEPPAHGPPVERRPNRVLLISSSRWGRHARGTRGSRRRRAVVSLLVSALLVVGVLALLPEGPVRGVPAGAPSLTGAYIVGAGAALVIVGYVGFANEWTAAPNGSSVFSSAFYLVFFNLHTYNSTVSVGVRQSNGYWTNTTVTVPALGQNAVTVTTSTDTSWVATWLIFDGTPYWEGPVATPISLLPNYILNVGGLDLFALVLVSFMMLNIMAGVVVGRWAIRRAGWAPRFSMLVWGHVVLALIAAGVFLDYQQIDATFAGWSPLVYPWLTFPMAFLWALSLFNRARRVEVIEGAVTPSGEFGWYRSILRIGRVKGKLVWIGGTWGNFWARFWGHHSFVEDANPEAPKPWLAPVVNVPSPTATPRERLRARLDAERSPADPTAEALTHFPVLSDTRDQVEYLAWGRAGTEIDPQYPRLSIHTRRHYDAEYGPPLTVGGPPTLVRPERWRDRLTWPHYVDPPPTPAPQLESVHFLPAAAAWAGFASLRDLGRVLSKYLLAFESLSAHVESRVEDELYQALRVRATLVGRPSSGITEEEALKLGATLPDLTRPRGERPTGGGT